MSNSSRKTPNHLIHETSPYLLQHAYNPVDWYPWGEKALEKARGEEKLLLVSIGYAACHWCHVMESESFEDAEVAAYMNQHFVCIKIDREERPDIDQIYMGAVQILTGRGGWPLNCIALPDGRPVYGGTYFPKTRWMEFLRYMVDFVQANPEKTIQQANQLTAGIQKNDLVNFKQDSTPHRVSDLEELFELWKDQIDFDYGGQRGNIKFPMPSGLEYLLQYHALTGDSEALYAVKVTLDRIAQGGIYDQIGGGFSRYSTDPYWKVPHFEKMLYDNAQLVSLYCHAYQVTQNPAYRRVVTETLEFVRRELSDDLGGFYSALDADSEGVEGRYYVWTMDEINRVLGDEASLFTDFYQVTESGNWEGRNILHRPTDEEDFARDRGMTLEELSRRLDTANTKLLSARQERVPPALDDKILAAWNGMMLQAFAVAYRTFGRQADLDTARKAGNFIRDHMKRADGGLFRNYKNGKASINGFLDDYAFVISGFIELYQATFEEDWITEAQQLLEYAMEHFFDPEKPMFYYTSDLDPALVARKMEIPDNVIPSSNSQMARNLYVLGTYLYQENYVDIARQMVRQVKRQAIQQGPYFSNWAIVLSWLIHPPYEVAIVGGDWREVLSAWNRKYLPFVLLAGGDRGGNLELLKDKYRSGETLTYVCREKVCQQPVRTMDEAMEQMK